MSSRPHRRLDTEDILEQHMAGRAPREIAQRCGVRTRRSWRRAVQSPRAVGGRVTTVRVPPRLRRASVAC